MKGIIESNTFVLEVHVHYLHYIVMCHMFSGILTESRHDLHYSIAMNDISQLPQLTNYRPCHLIHHMSQILVHSSLIPNQLHPFPTVLIALNNPDILLVSAESILLSTSEDYQPLVRLDILVLALFFLLSRLVCFDHLMNLHLHPNLVQFPYTM